jgi:YD repeat-containing protein
MHPRVAHLTPLAVWAVSAAAAAQTLPDPNGACLVAYDTNADGIPESYTTHRFEPDGRLAEERYDEDGDGEPEVITTYTRRRGEGVRIAGTWVAGGRIFRSTDASYDDEGRIGSLAYDLDGDGRHEAVERYDYDGQGRLTRVRFDTDNDGTIDGVAELRWDGDNLVSETLDEDGDGSVDFSVRVAWAGGTPVRDAIDLDGDGRDDVVTICIDDPGARTRFCERDIDGDGVYDSVIETRFDLAGRVQIETRHPSDAPSSWQHLHTEYDALARHPLDHRWFGLEGRVVMPGIPDESVRISYDAEGRVVARETDTGRDGIVDRRVRYEYACD